MTAVKTMINARGFMLLRTIFGEMPDKSTRAAVKRVRSRKADTLFARKIAVMKRMEITILTLGSNRWRRETPSQYCPNAMSCFIVQFISFFGGLDGGSAVQRNAFSISAA